MAHVRITSASLTAIAAAVLAACGGGSSDDTTPADTNAYVVGTAAYGAPMAKATVTLTDKTGKTVTATSDDDGSYKALVSGFTAPLFITATGASGDSVRTYHALVEAAVVPGASSRGNVTPLTEAIVAMASSDGRSPEEFADAAKLGAVDAAKLARATSAVKAIIKDVAAELGDASFDPLSSAFKADRSSAGDKLLDTIKVAVDAGGVSLRNVAVPMASTDVGAPAAATVTIADVTTQAATALPKPVVTDGATLLDPWVAQMNKCLALPQTARASLNATGEATALLGDCASVSAFSANYQRSGYTLMQYWGRQLAAVIPEGARFDAPEVLGFLTDADGTHRAIVRLPYSSANGAGSTVEVARKTGTAWVVEGNQRHYDASIGFRILRQTDVSTNPFVPTRGPDAGKAVGNFSAYTTRLVVNFNQSGPNGANIYAVRVRGPGLPAAGVVMARSSTCGTGDYLAFYRNDGVLPTAPAMGSTFPLQSSSGTNGYTIGLMPYGNTYTGSDFYNEYRGRNGDGSATTSVSSNIAAKPVDVATIPDLAAYSFEVFRAGTSVVDTFVTRNVAKPLAVATAAKLPWATLSAESLKYADPNGAYTGELGGATLSWAIARGAPWVTTAYMYGTGNDTATPPVFRRMNMGQGVKALGDTTVAIIGAAEADGNGRNCVYDKVPRFSTTSGYREVGIRQSRADSVAMQQWVAHTGRAAVVK